MRSKAWWHSGVGSSGNAYLCLPFSLLVWRATRSRRSVQRRDLRMHDCHTVRHKRHSVHWRLRSSDLRNALSQQRTTELADCWYKASPRQRTRDCVEVAVAEACGGTRTARACRMQSSRHPQACSTARQCESKSDSDSVRPFISARGFRSGEIARKAMPNSRQTTFTVSNRGIVSGNSFRLARACHCVTPLTVSLSRPDALLCKHAVKLVTDRVFTAQFANMRAHTQWLCANVCRASSACTNKVTIKHCHNITDFLPHIFRTKRKRTLQ